MLIFGNGKFAEVIKYYKGCSTTVHRKYCKESDVPFEDLRPGGVYSRMIVAVGYRYRRKIFDEVLKRGFPAIEFVLDHKADYSYMGASNIIFELNNFQPYSSIGDNNVFWSGSHIGHHAKIGSHNFITSHCVISGSVEIGDECFLGVNCTVLDGIKIGNRCIIAAGAVVDRDIPDNHILSRKGVLIALEKDSELAPVA